MANGFSQPGPWDRVAKGYVDATQPLLASFARDVLDALALDPSHALLDVAAGPGTLALQAAARVARVEAIDFAPAMVAELDKAAAAAGLANVGARAGDGQALPFADDSFDRVCSNFGVLFFADRARGLRELHRVSKPGGLVAVTSWQPLDHSPFFQLLIGSLAAAEALPEPDPDAEPASHLDDPEGFAAELADAGFVDVEIRELAHSVRLESVEAFWANLERGNVLIHELRRAQGPEAFAAIAERAQAWLRDQVECPSEQGARAYLGLGRKRMPAG